jgi:hypothetical protein
MCVLAQPQRARSSISAQSNDRFDRILPVRRGDLLLPGTPEAVILAADGSEPGMSDKAAVADEIRFAAANDGKAAGDDDRHPRLSRRWMSS